MCQRKDDDDPIKRKNLGDTGNVSVKKAAKLHYHWSVLAITVVEYIHSFWKKCMSQFITRIIKMTIVSSGQTKGVFHFTACPKSSLRSVLSCSYPKVSINGFYLQRDSTHTAQG